MIISIFTIMIAVFPGIVEVVQVFSSNSPVSQVSASVSSVQTDVNSRFSIEFAVTNTGSPSSTDSYLSMSISRGLDIVSWSSTPSHPDLVFSVYEVGDLIWNDQDEQFPAEYVLLDVYKHPFDRDESVTIEIVFESPSYESATEWIKYRAAMLPAGVNYPTEVPTARDPSSSSSTDQQGYLVYTIDVNVRGSHEDSDWESIKKRAVERRTLYKDYHEKAFSSSWWRDAAKGLVDPNFDLYEPLKSTAKQLFKVLLPDALGTSYSIIDSAYSITAGLIDVFKLLAAIEYNEIANALYGASQEHNIEADLSALIAKVDSVIAACEAQDPDDLAASLVQEKQATESLYQGTVDFEKGIWLHLIDPTIPPVPFPWSDDDIYCLLVRYPQYCGLDDQFSIDIKEGHLVSLRVDLEANYLDVTDLLGDLRFLNAEVEALLVQRYVAPLVEDAYWTVDGEKTTEVRVGEEVVANVVLATYDSMKANGEVTVQVWKDIRFPRISDEKHDNYQTTELINLDVGEKSGVIQVSFAAEDISNPIPGFGFQGYYLKVRFTGDGIPNKDSNRIEDVWVTWIDGGEGNMKNEYPPRLTVKGRILKIVARSPVNLFVTDPNGLRVGYEPESQTVINEIAGATYSGPASGSEPQFMTIPSPVQGGYVIDAYGTETGNYTITIESTATNGTEFATLTLKGTTSHGKLNRHLIELKEDFTVVSLAEHSQEWILVVVVVVGFGTAILIYLFVKKFRTTEIERLDCAF